MSIATSLVGGIAGGLGGALSAGSEKKANQRAGAAAAWDPTNLSGAGGMVNWTGTGAAGNPYQANLTGDATTQGLLNLFSQRAMGALGNPATGGFQNWAAGLGNGGIQDLFSNALNQAGNLPVDSYLQNQNNLGLLGGQAGALTGAITGNLQNSQLGNQGNMLLGTGLGGTLGAANNLFGAVQMSPQSFGDVYNQQLSALRAGALPQQQQQFNMFQNSAFSKGQLGTTGGANNLQAFLGAQNQQDLGFQNQAFNNANTMQQINNQQMQSQAGLNLNALMGQGNLYSGLLSGGQNLLGLNSQNQLGMLGQAQGLLGLQGNLAQQAFGNAGTMYGLQNAAGQQGLQNIMSLFGAGSQLGTQDINNAMNLLQGNLGINQNLQNLLQLSNNSSTGQAAAGANQARYLANTGQNALGSFFTGFGSAMGGAGAPKTVGGLFGG